MTEPATTKARPRWLTRLWVTSCSMLALATLLIGGAQWWSDRDRDKLDALGRTETLPFEFVLDPAVCYRFEVYARDAPAENASSWIGFAPEQDARWWSDELRAPIELDGVLLGFVGQAAVWWPRNPADEMTTVSLDPAVGSEMAVAVRIVAWRPMGAPPGAMWMWLLGIPSLFFGGMLLLSAVIGSVMARMK